jgi:hypothetical protein
MDFTSRYLYVSSEDKTAASGYRPHEAHDFTVSLPYPLWLKPDQWEIALNSIAFVGSFLPPAPKMVTVCCEGIEDSIINGSQAPVLRRLLNREITHVSLDFNTLEYKGLVRSSLTSIRIYLQTEEGLPAKLSQTSWLYCTLHLRRKNTLL